MTAEYICYLYNCHGPKKIFSVIVSLKNWIAINDRMFNYYSGRMTRKEDQEGNY